jgi:hypothetical protein
MSLKVEDSRKLLVKIVGTERNLTQAALIQKFRSFLLTRVKTHLAAQIKKDSINIFEIDENLERLSEQLREIFIPDFDDYGVSLERFFVTTIVKPETDPAYKRFRELHTRQYTDVAEARLRQQVGLIDQEADAQKMILEAQGIAQKRLLEGYTYQDERGFDVAEKMAENEAVGQMGNLGVGLGVMTGVGGAMGNMMGNVMSPLLNNNNAAPVTPTVATPVMPSVTIPITPSTTPSEPTETTSSAPTETKGETIFCMECGTKLPRTAKFCLSCGAKMGVAE